MPHFVSLPLHLQKDLYAQTKLVSALNPEAVMLKFKLFNEDSNQDRLYIPIGIIIQAFANYTNELRIVKFKNNYISHELSQENIINKTQRLRYFHNVKKNNSDIDLIYMNKILDLNINDIKILNKYFKTMLNEVRYIFNSHKTILRKRKHNIKRNLITLDN